MLNLFALLEMPESYSLNLAALEKAYFHWQRVYHPDRSVHKPASERVQALEHSANVNLAYETLKHPVKRAKHLLELRGVHVLSEKSAIQPDQATILEMMELQEAIADGQSPDLVAIVKTCENQLAEAFETSDIEAQTKHAIRLSYLYKIARL